MLIYRPSDQFQTGGRPIGVIGHFNMYCSHLRTSHDLTRGAVMQAGGCWRYKGVFAAAQYPLSAWMQRHWRMPFQPTQPAATSAASWTRLCWCVCDQHWMSSPCISSLLCRVRRQRMHRTHSSCVVQNIILLCNVVFTYSISFQKI